NIVSVTNRRLFYLIDSGNIRFTNIIIPSYLVILNIINTFVLLKKYFYIIILIAGFGFSSNAQVKSTFGNDDVVKTVKFYPNPAVGFINFEFDRSYDKTYTLYIFRSEEHTSELQSRENFVCRLLLEKNKIRC